jgi:hypothetical protein
MTAGCEPVTTAGAIALGNLDARIRSQVWQLARGLLMAGERAELVELLAMRGHLLGRIAERPDSVELYQQQEVCHGNAYRAGELPAAGPRT